MLVTPKNSLILAGVLGCIFGFVVGLSRAETEENSAAPPGDTIDQAVAKPFRVESIRGKVVWYAEGLKSQFGITTVDEAADRVLAVATPDGELIPIVEDLRGRAFRSDERLREMDVELRVRRYAGTPAVQIVRVYEWRDGKKFQVDYWCDVCAIIMFETGPCSCCQDHNRLRQRPVESP